MTAKREQSHSRREFLGASVAVPAALVIAAVSAAGAATPGLAATPACGDDGRPTLPQTEGPYFKPRSPLRASLLEPGLPGTRLVLVGRVLGTDCQPVPRALLDFWQADAEGRYDAAGFRLRGHQFADGAGRYRLETVVPGLYPGRTRHVHVKVQAPGQSVLTTQLYFPGEPRNAGDWLFRRELLVSLADAGDAKGATFDFVLDVTRGRAAAIRP